jgi:hypothetical protein
MKRRTFKGIIPMAHLVEQMAYAGAPLAWSGQSPDPKQPLEVWQREAGMDWKIQESPVHFKAETVGTWARFTPFRNRRCSIAPTPRPLSVVSNRYQVVQPREVLEFYRDLTEVSGYELETAGYSKVVASSGLWPVPGRQPR